MEVDGEAGEAGEAAEATVAAIAPAVPSSLVRPPFDKCIAEIVELLMEDLFGETAAAKEVKRKKKHTAKKKKNQESYRRLHLALSCYSIIVADPTSRNGFRI